MYFSIIILLILLLFCLFFGIWRRRAAIRKVCGMSCGEKCELSDTLLAPFGYCYNPKQDIISTRNDAWQRQAGYTALFDRAALGFHMVFDALPIYFNYQNRTWLIELWKGQYGINTGAEMGVYYADRILDESELKTAVFQAVSDSDRLPMSFTLLCENRTLASVSDVSWWLTAFLVGHYSKPSQLSMDCVIRFPDREMQCRFVEALKQTAPDMSFHCQGPKVHLCYAEGCPVSPVCPETVSCFRRLRIRWANLCNRVCCRAYCFITRPFHCTLDKILYLYYLLPFILRRMLRRLKGAVRV